MMNHFEALYGIQIEDQIEDTIGHVEPAKPVTVKCKSSHIERSYTFADVMQAAEFIHSILNHYEGSKAFGKEDGSIFVAIKH